MRELQFWLQLIPNREDIMLKCLPMKMSTSPTLYSPDLILFLSYLMNVISPKMTNWPTTSPLFIERAPTPTNKRTSILNKKLKLSLLLLNNTILPLRKNFMGFSVRNMWKKGEKIKIKKNLMSILMLLLEVF